MTQETPCTAGNDLNPEVWLDEHGDALYRFAVFRVQDSHTAEDLVQETLACGIKSIQSFDGRSSLRTWLIAILRRRIADHFNRVARQSQVPLEQATNTDELENKNFSEQYASLLRPAISSQQFESSIEKNEFWTIVEGCLRQLPIHLQEAFLHRVRNEQCTLADISKDLEITQANLSVRLFRARLLMRACLEQNWLNT